MHLDQVGTPEDPGPYWVSSLPWTIDKATLVDNRAAVLGVMNSTRRKLERDPMWKEIYETQLKDLIKNGFAKEVSEEELKGWKMKGGKVYYISHQVALNPASKSTPIRVVFNSSQMYKGYSLNSSWELGPDVLNNLHGVLLRFRKDYCGGQGDIRKMYYMIRILLEEQMMQLFMWQFPEEERMKTFCMTRLVMGNKPSGSISLVSLRQTSDLEDNAERYPAAHEAINLDFYVYNIFRTAPDMDTLKKNIDEIEFVSAMGGFFYKDWIIGGQDLPDQLIGIQLPHAIEEIEEICPITKTNQCMSANKKSQPLDIPQEPTSKQLDGIPIIYSNLCLKLRFEVCSIKLLLHLLAFTVVCGCRTYPCCIRSLGQYSP